MDLLALPKEYAVAHCVARDVRASRGLATVFRRKFGGTKELERQEPRVGKTLHRDHGGRRLFYLVAKESSQQRTTEDDLRSCLIHLRDLALRLGVTKLAIPKLGHGYDGVGWNVVRRMLEELFSDSGIALTVCIFNPWKSKTAAAHPTRRKKPPQTPVLLRRELVWGRPVFKGGDSVTFQPGGGMEVKRRSGGQTTIETPVPEYGDKRP